MRWISPLLMVLLSTAAMAQTGADERIILQRRAASNAAIARHDTAGIGATMAENIIVVTSRSAQAIGRGANLTAFTDQFHTLPDVVYERTPSQVHVYDAWGMASEQGRWTGSWTDTDGKIQIGGIYFAKWRLRNGSWLIESETYVPDRCNGGSYCRIAP
jgi:hypothetical protein